MSIIIHRHLGKETSFEQLLTEHTQKSITEIMDREYFHVFQVTHVCGGEDFGWPKQLKL